MIFRDPYICVITLLCFRDSSSQSVEHTVPSHLHHITLPVDLPEANNRYLTFILQAAPDCSSIRNELLQQTFV